MRHTDKSPGIDIAFHIAACLLLFSCKGQVGSVAIIDPIIDYLSPETVRSFASVSKKLTVLPETGAQAALFAVLDGATPVTVFLSPLLGSEIPAILAKDDRMRVVYLGTESPKPDPRLYSAEFSPIDAAAAGGRLAAEEASNLRGERQSRVAAVFSGASDPGPLTAAFLAAFASAGGKGEPIVEFSASGFSQTIADRLKSMDVRIAYVSASPKDLERWIVEAFDPYAFVAAEYALATEHQDSSAKAFITWDVKKTLTILGKNLSKKESGSFPGLWKTVRNGQSGGNYL